MYKKVLMVLVAVFSLFALTACKERTYKADGVYTAFSEGLSNGAPQVTEVSVTIKNDKIESFNIDCLQSVLTKDEEEVITGITFNAKTKKELRYAYRMHGQFALSEEDYIDYLEENDELEWFEQAELLEAHFLANGTSLETDDNGYITNVASVSIADSDYSKLAAEAVANAKAGKVYSWMAYTSGTQANIVWAEGNVNDKGVLTSLSLDTLQGNVKENAFTWNEKTKQELKYAYRMHGHRELSEEDYKEWLEENEELEWFEQANLLSDYVFANGLANVKVATGGTLEDAPTTLAEVSVTVSHYVEVMEALLDEWK
ncbi:MAG: hypothetical protein PHX62_07620 [Bacilli bacterium]|nr:hypothetical protein [Bacilli bacterium]